MKKRFLLLTVLMVFMASIIATSVSAEIKVGVLAKRGPEKCLQKWLPTADYLSKVVGEKVRIVPMKFDAVKMMIEKNKVDFFLVNSSMYCNMKKQYGGNAIATLKNARQGKSLTSFSGVLFTKADSKINEIQEITGKSFCCVKKSSFGGYQMALNELKKYGINPETDCSVFKEMGTHDKSVEMVLKGVIEVGTVRSDTIERLIAEGKYKLSDFKIINSQESEFPFVHSTALYPEWPFAACKNTDAAITAKITEALLGMKPDSPASKAGKNHGWTKPLDYSPVENLLVALNLGAFASN